MGWHVHEGLGKVVMRARPLNWLRALLLGTAQAHSRHRLVRLLVRGRVQGDLEPHHRHAQGTSWLPLLSTPFSAAADCGCRKGRYATSLLSATGQRARARQAVGSAVAAVRGQSAQETRLGDSERSFLGDRLLPRSRESLLRLSCSIA